MGNLTVRSFEFPDETRTPDKAKVDVVDLNGTKAARLTLQPGWKWSECIQPVVGTDSCQVTHLGVASRGRLQVQHDDGTHIEINAGDVYTIAPGHDAWVDGDDEFVAYEFDSSAAETYAKTH